MPLLRFRRGKLDREVAIKYFLTQAWASAMFLLGLLGLQLSLTSELVEVAMLLKLGAAPLHLWFIRVLRKTSLENLFLLSTVQKILPLYMLQWVGVGYIRRMAVILSAVLAGWGVFNHTSVRAIFAYSSVFTVAWCVAGTREGMFLWMRYLGVYTVSLAVLLVAVRGVTEGTIGILFSSARLGYFKLALFLGLATLGGLPPLAGFWVKVLLLNALLTGQVFTRGVLLAGALWTLYMYMRFRYNGLVYGGHSRVWFTHFNPSGLGGVLILGLGLPLLFLISVVLLRSIIRKILIFKILGQPKLSTQVD